MGKKKINILLLLTVLGLWGTVAYKYIGHFFHENTQLDLSENLANITLPKTIKKDPFVLSTLTSDPFLKKNISPTPGPDVITEPIIPLPNIPKIINKPKPVLKPVKTETPFPEVKYYGFIKSKEKAEELILLKINNQLYKTRTNADCQGVSIIKIYRDSIEVRFEKRKAVIYKNR
ncbi:hypothetical protein [Flavobacterium oreochromis]|uniref:hypothetical protein n=1 Tax=Flavobacterium oreochromis TaxID=2906078 RepID=UPI000CDB73A9|nr:hypothetical protein BWK58_10205 [Flavobacterium columnare]